MAVQKVVMYKDGAGNNHADYNAAQAADKLFRIQKQREETAKRHKAKLYNPLSKILQNSQTIQLLVPDLASYGKREAVEELRDALNGVLAWHRDVDRAKAKTKV